jgi:hypothetical protein
MRRPYFPDARLFFEIMAPTYSIDATHMMRWLSDPDAFANHPGHPGAQMPSHQPASQVPANGGRRRRRWRRRSRYGGPRNHPPATTSQSEHSQVGASGDAHHGDASPQSPEPNRRE